MYSILQVVGFITSPDAAPKHSQGDQEIWLQIDSFANHL